MGDIVLQRWRYYCEIRQKMISTKSALPESAIKGEHPDAVPIEGSAVIIKSEGDPFENRLSNMLAKAPPCGEFPAFVPLAEMGKDKGRNKG